MANGDEQRAFLRHAQPEGFLALQKSQLLLMPATGKPDPQRLKDFLKAYPEAERSLKWAAQKPAPGSFAGATFYSINAFYLVNAPGGTSSRSLDDASTEPFLSISSEQRQKADDNFLFENLRQRLAPEPLYWDYVLQLAQPGDPVDDPSQPWPDDRKKRVAGTLEVTRVEAQSTGACRQDVNFDPSVVPAGVAVSDDPILNARSAAYSHSFSRREREIGYGKATEAVQKQEVK